jgi:hypothetical protein
MVFASAGTTIATLAAMAGADVSIDPRSSDFGKIKIGNTRVDLWGGFQQYIRLAAQLTTGQTVSSSSGRVTNLGQGYKPTTRLDVLLNAVESKTAPVLSFAIDLLKGQDYQGKPINVPVDAAQRFIPMIAGDVWDIAQSNPDLLPLSALGVFGAGLQTY